MLYVEFLHVHKLPVSNYSFFHWNIFKALISFLVKFWFWKNVFVYYFFILFHTHFSCFICIEIFLKRYFCFLFNFDFEKIFLRIMSPSYFILKFWFLKNLSTNSAELIKLYLTSCIAATCVRSETSQIEEENFLQVCRLGENMDDFLNDALFVAPWCRHLHLIYCRQVLDILYRLWRSFTSIIIKLCYLVFIYVIESIGISSMFLRQSDAQNINSPLRYFYWLSEKFGDILNVLLFFFCNQMTFLSELPVWLYRNFTSFIPKLCN